MITVSGVGSGLDVDGIVTGLMELERAPVRRLESRRDRVDVELSAFASARSLMGELAGAAGKLGDAATIAPVLAESSDEDVLTATASASAAEGGHDIEVLSLASEHRLATPGYASDEASVGGGTWNFASGETAFEIDLTGGDDSLAALRDAINDHPDNGAIVASTIDVDAGTRLVLTAREPGTANEIDATKTTSGGGFLGGGTTTERPFGEVSEAADARLRVDGFEVTRSTNTIDDVLDGVTLSLAGTGEARVEASRDGEAMVENLTAFVEKYNALRTELGKLGEGSLQGDRLPRNVDTDLRRAFSTDIELADGTRLAPIELGLSFDKHGTLSLDTAELDRIRNAGAERLIEAYSRPVDGFAAKLSQVLEEYTRAEGRIDVREDGLESRKERLGDMIERTEYRMEKIEARYRREFSAMDQMVGTLQTTSSLLVDKLSNPPS